jgi:hypothetical protein
MSKWWYIFLIILLLVIWVVSGGYMTQTSILLTNYKNVDNNLSSAYWYAFAVAFITWTLVILAIFGLAGLFFFAPEIAVASTEAAEASFTTPQVGMLASQAASTITVLSIIIALILVFVTGILSALTATNIVGSSNYKTSDLNLSKAYNDSIVATALSLVTGILLIIFMVSYFVSKHVETSKVAENSPMGPGGYSGPYQSQQQQFTTRQSTTPQFTTPQVTSPQFTTPQVTARRFTTPQVTAPQFTTPQVTAAQTKSSQEQTRTKQRQFQQNQSRLPQTQPSQQQLIRSKQPQVSQKQPTPTKGAKASPKRS